MSFIQNIDVSRVGTEGVFFSPWLVLEGTSFSGLTSSLPVLFPFLSFFPLFPFHFDTIFPAGLQTHWEVGQPLKPPLTLPALPSAAYAACTSDRSSEQRMALWVPSSLLARDVPPLAQGVTKDQEFCLFQKFQGCGRDSWKVGLSGWDCLCQTSPCCLVECLSC